MKEDTNNCKKNVGTSIARPEKGITLIALIITIVVMLILVAATITIALGPNGIIAKAKESKTKTDNQMAYEQGDIASGIVEVKGQKYTIQNDGTLQPVGNSGEGQLGGAQTLASVVEVGDYVEYNYTAGEYETTLPITEDGTSQSFDSNKTTGIEKVTEWRVLSKKDEIVELVSANSVSGLELGGANGYINGPTVLNQICENLYSSDKGTARSINVEDLNDIAEYDGHKIYYIEGSSDEETISANETKTIGEVADDYIGRDALFFEGSLPEEETTIWDYEINYYDYSFINSLLSNDDYWLASSYVSADFRLLPEVYAGFGVRYVSGGFVDGLDLFQHNDLSNAFTRGLLPVVTLNSGLQVNTADSTKNGTSVANAWVIK